MQHLKTSTSETHLLNFKSISMVPLQTSKDEMIKLLKKQNIWRQLPTKKCNLPFKPRSSKSNSMIQQHHIWNHPWTVARDLHPKVIILFLFNMKVQIGDTHTSGSSKFPKLIWYGASSSDVKIQGAKNKLQSTTYFLEVTYLSKMGRRYMSGLDSMAFDTVYKTIMAYLYLQWPSRKHFLSWKQSHYHQCSSGWSPK